MCYIGQMRRKPFFFFLCVCTLFSKSNPKSSFASLSPNPRQISHLGCINMPELHTSSHAGGLAGYRAALWHQSGMMAAPFVMLTGIASSLIQMLSFSFSLPSSLSPFLPPHGPCKSILREFEKEGERTREGVRTPCPQKRWSVGLSPGGQRGSCSAELFPCPAERISYSNAPIRPVTHGGLFYSPGLGSAGQDGDLIARAMGEKRERSDLVTEWVIKKHFS